MQIREYKSKDIASINKWLAKRKLPKVSEAELPKLGFVIPGVAIAFLRQCEGNLAIFDSLVTNPYVSSLTRNVALDDLFAKLKAEASPKVLIGYSQDAGSIERACRHGFSVSNQFILVHKE